MEKSGPGKIAITCGDPAGVGPELVSVWVEQHRTVACSSVVLIGPRRWLAQPGFSEIETVPVGDDDFFDEPGRPSLDGARVAIEAMETAASGCRQGRFSAVVSCPVNKFQLHQAGFSFPGQTEFFAERWGGEPVMGFCGGALRVTLATWHLPLQDVAKRLNETLLTRAIEQADALARLDGVANPRMAVCGLNPHAGEQGLLGREEVDWINPLLGILSERFSVAPEALAGDTVFYRALRGEFDVVVALFHDQGLAPLKTVAFDESVNVTLGLPYLRVSPDHGTAFALAGTGTASCRSLTRAIEFVLGR